jgi:hypothetical protein
VALAAGSLDGPKSNPREGARKQVIVVVTAGWSILCFDHNLKLLWENNVQVGGLVKAEDSIAFSRLDAPMRSHVHSFVINMLLSVYKDNIRGTKTPAFLRILLKLLSESTSVRQCTKSEI